MITPEVIKKLVEKYFEVNLKKKIRKHPVPSAKYCYYNLCKIYTKETLSVISGTINQDHASALHYINNYGLKKNDDYHLIMLMNKIRDVIGDDNVLEKIQDSSFLTDKLLKYRLRIDELESELNSIKETIDVDFDEKIKKFFIGNQRRLNEVFTELPERMQEDLLFKAEVALKLNRKSA